nr:hypothetical protein BaRGS_021815 [Batillaria attramentaria]
MRVTEHLKNTKRHCDDQTKQTAVESTAVRKLKKKKKKAGSAKGEQNIATVGDNSMYSYPATEDNHTQTLPLPAVNAKGKQKTAKKGKAQTLEKDVPHSDSEDSLKEVASTPVTKVSSSPAALTHSKKKTSSNTQKSLEDTAESADLNSTTMFTLNSSAKLLPDGSLDYTGRNAFSKLPLTPIMFRRQPDIPPLDLTALRSSSDSVMSSNTYQPYSATVRSTDTYRPARSDLVLPHQLRSVPEGTIDVNV